MAQAELSRLSPVSFLEALQATNEQVLQAMYTQHYPGVEKYIRQNNGTADDARDIYQEAFVAVWRNVRLNRFAPADSREFGAYLFRVVKNKWIDYLRAHQHKQTITLEPEEAHTISAEENEANNYIDAVRKQFTTLGERCRELLERFYFRKESLRKIAAFFSWTEASAKNNKYRCLQQLRELVNKNEQ